jgi:membrane-bound metal-dependent hydrolase YbcI (DUF457 family)
MMGKSHALTGLTGAAIGWAAMHGSVGPAEVVIGGSMMVGGAMIPDIDHPNSNSSRTFGPVTGAFCWLIGKATGGHRRGTHSITGVAALAGLMMIGLAYRHTPAVVLLIFPMIIALASAVRLFRIPGYLDDLAPVPIIIGLVLFTPLPLWYVPGAVGVGCLIHIAGDLITRQKIPVWWPWSRTGYALNLITTNGVAERWVITPACWLTIIYSIYRGVS